MNEVFLRRPNSYLRLVHRQCPKAAPHFCSLLTTLMLSDLWFCSVCVEPLLIRAVSGTTRQEYLTDSSGEESIAGGFETPARL